MTRILFYSPANLNKIDGSAIWVQSVAETLHVSPTTEIVLPLRAPEQRDVITGLLRRLPRVELIPAQRAVRRKVGANGIATNEVLSLIERLDREKPFDVILIRSFEVAQAAVRSQRLRDRLWSTYVLEPENDPKSAAHVRDLTEIATGSRYLVAQSEEMRALTEAIVPAARGKTILLPPAIPAAPARRADPDRIVPRLIYTGKFSPFYPVRQMIGFFQELRAEIPGLEFHVVGDKIHRPREDPTRAPPGTRPDPHGWRGLAWRAAARPGRAARRRGGCGPEPVGLPSWLADERPGDLDEAPRLRLGRRAGDPQSDRRPGDGPGAGLPAVRDPAGRGPAAPPTDTRRSGPLPSGGRANLRRQPAPSPIRTCSPASRRSSTGPGRRRL